MKYLVWNIHWRDAVLSVVGDVNLKSVHTLDMKKKFMALKLELWISTIKIVDIHN